MCEMKPCSLLWSKVISNVFKSLLTLKTKYISTWKWMHSFSNQNSCMTWQALKEPVLPINWSSRPWNSCPEQGILKFLGRFSMIYINRWKPLQKWPSRWYLLCILCVVSCTSRVDTVCRPLYSIQSTYKESILAH